ncbi:hypothetical protein CapIbe_000114 [Capra ibex]
MESFPGGTVTAAPENACYCCNEKGEKLVVLSSVPAPEKAMAPRSSTLAWKIPWTEEPAIKKPLFCTEKLTVLDVIIHETWVQSLGQEDPLDKEMATHSSTLAWKIPWTEESASA